MNIGYSGFVVGKRPGMWRTRMSSHSCFRNLRAVLAVEPPLRRAQRGLDCSGWLWKPLLWRNGDYQGRPLGLVFARFDLVYLLKTRKTVNIRHEPVMRFTDYESDRKAWSSSIRFGFSISFWTCR